MVMISCWVKKGKYSIRHIFLNIYKNTKKKNLVRNSDMFTCDISSNLNLNSTLIYFYNEYIYIVLN